MNGRPFDRLRANGRNNRKTLRGRLGLHPYLESLVSCNIWCNCVGFDLKFDTDLRGETR